jgi:hypothetical protein
MKRHAHVEGKPAAVEQRAIARDQKRGHAWCYSYQPLSGPGQTLKIVRSRTIAKDCQRPDSAAGEIPHTPRRSPRPSAASR